MYTASQLTAMYWQAVRDGKGEYARALWAKIDEVNGGVWAKIDAQRAYGARSQTRRTGYATFDGCSNNGE